MLIAHIKVPKRSSGDDNDAPFEESQDLYCTVENIVLAPKETIYYLSATVRLVSYYWLTTQNLQLHLQQDGYQLHYDCCYQDFKIDDEGVYVDGDIVWRSQTIEVEVKFLTDFPVIDW